ncbi:hypothetical protein [Hyphomicrobium sulfonivorans]|uniref:hypothetical protein n=1 Tax=Hyphomicrobium sulfonivorans TaxID=121290 RepID=UPI00156D5ABE|nr:hypothetical protein [Hyphomicrobium sulfonivorans]MBI1650116.1 hypothetical protein [Hyphomicrobium sulfonivorans]
MTDRSNSFPPSIPLCRLYERTSKKGNPYLTGRLGTDYTKRSAADEMAMRRSQEPIDRTLL